MNRILLVYGTSEGQTQKIAGDISETLRARGFEVDVVRAGSADPNPDRYDGVIVAASVHVGGYQKPVAVWVRAHAVQLTRMPSAFVSVCLSILSKNEAGRKEAAAIPQRFIDSLQWHPSVVKIVAGALPYSQYNFFKRWMMKRIVASAGGDIDTSRDYEYTDWDDLRSFAREFVRRVIVPVAA